MRDPARDAPRFAARRAAATDVLAGATGQKGRGSPDAVRCDAVSGRLRSRLRSRLRTPVPSPVAVVMAAKAVVLATALTVMARVVAQVVARAMVPVMVPVMVCRLPSERWRVVS
ncbi:hypothetical protein [Kribbella sp. VKM Ac-2571]|uniref:hypothetical protein n=1 Tax=Kribbella sp. VKM Ac-2571 TaxID=2512222 RepID=UPI00105D733F|nr:hypothetical protein [Kribbella sp. VKM Ac-2571]